jgi:uncharacterized cupin superfamily protein
MPINLLGEDWSSKNDQPGYRWRRMRIAGECLGASLYELPPGERTWKYHYEVGNEELLLVVLGRPTLRDPDGERELRPGDCVLFPQGPDGAHQVINRSDEPARILIVSNFAIPRAAFYPDSDEIKVRWSPRADDALMWRRDDALEYWDSEGGSSEP